MRLRVFAAALVALPSPAFAQNTWSVAPYLATNGSLPDGSALAGVTLTRQASLLGLRGGFGFAAWQGDDRITDTGEDAWTADADVRLAPRFTGGYVPLLFAGLGVEGARVEGEMEVVPMWSAGAGFGYELLPWARLDSEARYRVPFISTGSAAAFSRGWEFRVGLALSWRTGRRSTAPGRPLVGTSLPATVEAGTAAPARASAAPDMLAFRLVDSAEDNLGTPYVWGGSTTAGFDCSGFVQHVFRAHNVKLPRTSRQMAHVGTPISGSESSWRVGDLLFFAGNGRTIDHVAMYAGDGRIIHSTSTGGGVRYDQLASNRGGWFLDRLVAVRRVLGQPALAAPAVADDDGPSDPPDKAPPVRRGQS